MDAKHNLFLSKICDRYTIPLPGKVREPVGVKRVNKGYGPRYHEVPPSYRTDNFRQER